MNRFQVLKKHEQENYPAHQDFYAHAKGILKNLKPRTTYLVKLQMVYEYGTPPPPVYLVVRVKRYNANSIRFKTLTISKEHIFGINYHRNEPMMMETTVGYNHIEEFAEFDESMAPLMVNNEYISKQFKKEFFHA